MALLALGHRLPAMVQHQQEKSWPADRWERFQPQELRGSTVVCWAMAHRGELARLLQPLDVNILATSATSDIRRMWVTPHPAQATRRRTLSRLNR